MTNPTKFSSSQQSSNGKSKRAAIYARVSSHEQIDNYSLQTQVDSARLYCDRQGYTVVEPPFEEDHTGMERFRPKLNALRELAERSAINYIVVHDPDRLSRKLNDQVIITAEFENKGVAIEFSGEEWLNTEQGRMFRYLRGIASEIEHERIVERTTRGRIARVKAGKIVPGTYATFGFIYRDGQYEIDEFEAKIVTQMFKWCAEGDEYGRKLSTPKIAERLTEMGIPSRYDKLPQKKHKGVWSRVTVNAMLHDEIYIGRYYYGKVGRPVENGVNKRVPRPREEWIMVKVPRIIDDDLWHKAQAQLAANRHLPTRKATREFLMRKRLTCAHCGYTLHASGGYPQQGRKHARAKVYLCGFKDTDKYQYGEKFCRKSLKTELIDTQVWEYVREVLQNPNKILAAMQGKRAETEKQRQTHLEHLAIVRRKLNEAQRKVQQLLDKWLDTVFSEEELRQKRAEIDREVQRYTVEEHDIMERIERLNKSDYDPERIQETCQRARKGIDDFTFADKCAVLDMLQITGTLYRDESGTPDYVIIQGILPEAVRVDTVNGAVCPRTKLPPMSGAI